MLREFSSLSKIFPVCLQPGCLFFTPPLILSLRRLHFTLGGPQTPSAEWGAFRVPWWMLMGDSFRSFYRVGLWSAGWLALHRLDIQRTCKSPPPPPPLDTHTKTPVKKLQEHEGRKEEPRRVHRHERKDWECDSEKTKEKAEGEYVKKAETKKEKVQERDALGGRMVVRACGGCVCAVEN